MTKRNLSVSAEELTIILEELESIMKRLNTIIPKVEDTIGNLIIKEEIMDYCFEGD